MIEINQKLLDELFEKAEASDRKRMNYDLRTHSHRQAQGKLSSGQACEDGGQRMLNALLPGTCVPVHRHPKSNENVICLRGRLDEILYEEVSEPSSQSSGASGTAVSDGIKKFQGVKLVETERIHLCPSEGRYGCVVPPNVWHTVEVLEPSVILEAKDGKYGEDGSENFNDYLAKQHPASIPDNCIGDLKQHPSAELRNQITYLIGMERHSGSMEVITPLYVSRMLNVPLEEVEKAMKEMDL